MATHLPLCFKPEPSTAFWVFGTNLKLPGKEGEETRGRGGGGGREGRGGGRKDKGKKRKRRKERRREGKGKGRKEGEREVGFLEEMTTDLKGAEV
jgi:hypothetical protein